MDAIYKKIQVNTRRHRDLRLTLMASLAKRSGRVTQSSDVTMVGSLDSGHAANSSVFLSVKIFAQYNIKQDLQTFYKEIVSLEKGSREDIIKGRVRVAGFLPFFVKELDSSGGASYEESQAVAIYDYNIVLKKIDEVEASQM